ncbi:unnamed protein product [Brassica rapa]|uniref:Uncharacterized protein n=1 Tax=Brassica campestris TaxID=3711 RepID=A0A8D9GVU6_BRACM|nr:unnamed protein product [Brassica rapa]
MIIDEEFGEFLGFSMIIDEEFENKTAITSLSSLNILRKITKKYRLVPEEVGEFLSVPWYPFVV